MTGSRQAQRAVGKAWKVCKDPWETRALKLHSDGQICILEGSSGYYVNDLGKSKPVGRPTDLQADDDEGKSVAVGWERR